MGESDEQQVFSISRAVCMAQNVNNTALDLLTFPANPLKSPLLLLPCTSEPASSPQGHPTVSRVSGYLISNGQAEDDFQGQYLFHVLQKQNINLEQPPPFEPASIPAAKVTHGVVRIGNIPYTVTEQEISQFVTTYATKPMIKKHYQGFPVHIIMEKPTGKTMDCFVEFSDQDAAEDCVRRFEYTDVPSRRKLGTRAVSLSLSDQKELMEAIFPRARRVTYDQQVGVSEVRFIGANNAGNNGFRGYFTPEEIFGLIKFAEYPDRSPFVIKVHQRVYESMISTLYKFPWNAFKTYTIAARNVLYTAVHKQLQILVKKVERDDDDEEEIELWPHGTSIKRDESYRQREVGLNQNLLLDLLFAAVNVPCFSLAQKAELCNVAEPYGQGISLGDFATTWPFQVLQPARGVSSNVVKFWLELFDTGYDVMSETGCPTPYENVIVFTRNTAGHPVAEWTREGVKLSFDSAIRVETAAMLQIVCCGREVWAKERQIKASKWTETSMLAMINTITEGSTQGSKLLQGEPESNSLSEDEISPRSSCIATSPSQAQEAVVDDSHILAIRRLTDNNMAKSTLNAATSSDFIPYSTQPTMTSPTTLNSRMQLAQLRTQLEDPHTDIRFRNPFAVTAGSSHADMATLQRTFTNTSASEIPSISPATSLNIPATEPPNIKKMTKIGTGAISTSAGTTAGDIDKNPFVGKPLRRYQATTNLGFVSSDDVSEFGPIGTPRRGTSHRIRRHMQNSWPNSASPPLKPRFDRAASIPMVSTPQRYIARPGTHGSTPAALRSRLSAAELWHGIGQSTA